MRRQLVLVAIGGMIGLGVGVPAASASGLTLRFQLTSSAPDTPTGAVLDLGYPDDGPGGKPKAVSKGVYDFPAGTVFNESAVPVCTASDAEFDVLGDSACPQDTALGGGGITVDTGFGPPVDPFALDDSYFHGPDQLITVFRPHGAPAPVLQVNRLQIQGSKIIDLPSLPPGWPPGTKTVAKRVDQQITRVVSSAGLAFITTPPSCPSTGQWIAQVTITYDDGTVDSATSATPCQQPASRQTVIRRAAHLAARGGHKRALRRRHRHRA